MSSIDIDVSALEFSKFFTHPWGWVRGEMLLTQAISSLTPQKNMLKYIACTVVHRKVPVHTLQLELPFLLIYKFYF